MKTKLVLVVLAGVIIASCSSKKPVTTTESAVPKVETTKEVVLTPELMAGKSLYEQSCVKCHKLYSPKEYSQEDWKPILIKMQKKAHLDNVQMVSISNYISSQL